MVDLCDDPVSSPSFAVLLCDGLAELAMIVEGATVTTISVTTVSPASLVVVNADVLGGGVMTTGVGEGCVFDVFGGVVVVESGVVVCEVVVDEVTGEVVLLSVVVVVVVNEVLIGVVVVVIAAVVVVEVSGSGVVVVVVVSNGFVVVVVPVADVVVVVPGRGSPLWRRSSGTARCSARSGCAADAHRIAPDAARSMKWRLEGNGLPIVASNPGGMARAVFRDLEGLEGGKEAEDG